MSIDRRQTRVCIVVNLLACPGIGTFMAGRRLVGFMQALIMIVGCCAILAWVILQFNAGYKYVFDPMGTEAKWKAMQPPAWLGIVGGVLCIVAWLWGLFSSLQLLHESRRHQPV
ncbi:MAG TPA: hypothetical protein VJN01_08035 [Xanthomonadales bacterium]|nr:hypothetical protein [Xanthomonadales bacterium]